MLKKLLVVLMFICLVSFSAFARGEHEGTTSDDQSGRQESVTITVQMFSGPEYDAMVPTVDYWNENYAESTGIKVNCVALSRVGYFEKMQSQLIAGLDVPDVVHPFDMPLPKMKPYLEDMKPYLEDKEITTGPEGVTYSMDDMLEIALQTVTFDDGSIVALPKDMSEQIFYYRRDLIQNPPETWPEFLEVAKKFTQSHNPSSPTKYGCAMYGKYEKWTFYSALMMLWPAGYNMFKPGTLEIDNYNPDAVKALKIYEELFNNSVMYPGFENFEYPEVSAALQSGEVAMAIHWNADITDLTNPEKAPKVWNKIGYTVPPGWKQSDGSIERAMSFLTINLALNKNSKHKDESMKFLAWAVFGEGAKIYAESGGTSPIQQVWFADDAPDPYPFLAPAMTKYGRCLPQHKNLAELVMIGSSWIQKVGIGEATAEEAAEGMVDEMKAFLANK